MNLDIDDPTFIQDLEDSKQYVWRAARWLSDNGHNVTVRPTYIRPSVEQLHEYSDGGDLEIIQRIEVKRRPNLDFKSKNDFPYESIIVDVAHTWDNAHPKPYAYIIFNSNASACFIVLGSTYEFWIRKEKYDRQKNRYRTFYECPLSKCSFHLLNGVKDG